MLYSEHRSHLLAFRFLNFSSISCEIYFWQIYKNKATKEQAELIIELRLEAEKVEAKVARKGNLEAEEAAFVRKKQAE